MNKAPFTKNIRQDYNTEATKLCRMSWSIATEY